MAAAQVLLGNGQAPGGQCEDVGVAGDDVLGGGAEFTIALPVDARAA